MSNTTSKTLVERLEHEIANPDRSGAPYVNDTDLLAECLAEIKGRSATPATPAAVSVDEFVRYRSCLYRANGRLIQMGQEPEKLDYTDKSAPETSEVHSIAQRICEVARICDAAGYVQVPRFLVGSLREALKPTPAKASDDPNAPYRWICPKCSTVNAITDEVCLGGSCGTRRPQ